MSLLDTIKNLFCNNNCEKPESEQENKISEIVEDKAPAAEVKSEPVVEAKPEVKDVVAAAEKVDVAPLQIPEDSTLKRHFISALKVEIESGMPPRPSDATLRRNYDAEVQAKLEKLLS